MNMFPWKNIDQQSVDELTEAIQANTKMQQIVVGHIGHLVTLLEQQAERQAATSTQAPPVKDVCIQPKEDESKPPAISSAIAKWLFFDDPSYGGRSYKNLEHAILGGLRHQNFSTASLLSLFAKRYTSGKVVDAIAKLSSAELVRSIKSKRGASNAVFQITSKGKDILKGR